MMAAQKGKDLLLKIHDGASFVTVAGLRTRRLALNARASADR
jgi:predicted secreted protein